jgi:integral membrane protein (TIGR01906 family)
MRIQKKYLQEGFFAVITGSLLLLVILLTSIEGVAFDLKHYEKQYKILHSEEKLGINQGDLLKVTAEMLTYLRGERGNLNIEVEIEGVKSPFFTQREKKHMVDVQGLFSQGFKVRRYAVMLLLFFLLTSGVFSGRDWPAALARRIHYGSLAALFVVIASALLANTDFSFWFDQFHFLAFDNDLWRLNPQQHNLIQLVPLTFFQNTVVIILLRVIGFLFSLLLASRYCLLRIGKGSR